MTDRKHDPLVPSAASRPGALAKRPPGDLVARGLADLKALRQAMRDAEECFQRGERLRGKDNYVAAAPWYRRAAEQGHAHGQTQLGRMYRSGHGVSQDDAGAVRWFRLAAEQGNADAQLVLGVMYGEGRGVPQDDAEAVRWYRLAAEQGHAEA